MNTKNIFILLIALFTVQLAAAQASKVSNTYFLMDDYKNDKTVESLKKAKTEIDIASKHEITSLQGKTWYYRGLVYSMLSKEKMTMNDGADYLTEAVNSFEKALTLEDKKFRDDKKAILNLKDLAVVSFNKGIELQQANSFKEAFTKYQLVSKISDVLKANDSELTFDEKAVTKNATYAAEDGGMIDKAIAGYNQMIEEDPKDAYYFSLAKLYKKQENEEKYLQTLEEGSKAFPNNANIIIEQLNYLRANGKTTEAMAKIDKAIELQPDNEVLYFVKAKTFDNAGEKEKAIEVYEQAIKVNPKYTDAIYNIGAIHFLGGNPIIAQMNELTTSSADTKKYNELVEERKALYRKAKTYFERVLEIEPENANAISTLKKINRVLNQ